MDLETELEYEDVDLGQVGGGSEEEIEAIKEDVSLIKAEQEEQNTRIKNLFAIAKGNDQFVELKTEQAYTTRVTADGEEIFDEQLTAVTEIKGSTKRYENLIPYPYVDRNGTKIFTNDTSSKTIDGVTFTNNHGVITGNGTCTNKNGIWFPITGHLSVWNEQKDKSYYLSGCPSGGSNATYSLVFNKRKADGSEQSSLPDNGNGLKENIVSTSVTRSVIIYIVIRYGVTLNNIVFKPVLVEGEKAGEWQTPFSDLKHAYIKEIKSGGSNLFNKANIDPRAGYAFVNCTDISTSEDKNVLIATGKENETSDDYAYALGWVQPLSTAQDSEKVRYYNGETITVSADITLLQKGSRSAGVRCYFGGVEPANQKTISATKARYSWSFTMTKDGSSIPVFPINSNRVQIENIKVSRSANTEYSPFIEAFYNLPQTLELCKWDSFNSQTGEVLRQTGYATSETGFTEEEIAGYDGVIVSSDKLSLEYKLANPTIEKIYGVPKSYLVWDKGTETVIQGDVDNSEFGAMPTITNEYYAKVNTEVSTNEQTL